MEWYEILITNVVSLLTGLGGTILYFRPKLREARAEASVKETEAQNFMYESLMSRINSMEKYYNEQYESQNKVIEDLRQEVLKLTKEKFDNEKRMIQLEGENNALKERIDSLEKEVQAYKTIAGK